MRIIDGYRKEIEVNDNNFPKWAYNSEYAEQLWEMWNNSLADRIEIERCQDNSAFRKFLIRRCEVKVNS